VFFFRVFSRYLLAYLSVLNFQQNRIITAATIITKIKQNLPNNDPIPKTAQTQGLLKIA
jgi:hypothetical protein